MSNTRGDCDIRIRMLKTVRPDFLFMAKPGTILRADEECNAVSNQYGAISGISENGERLGVKPGEFEFVEAPDWVLDIWKNLCPVCGSE